MPVDLLGYACGFFCCLPEESRSKPLIWEDDGGVSVMRPIPVGGEYIIPYRYHAIFKYSSTEY